MVRRIEILVSFAMIVALAHGPKALAAGSAPDICSARDDKADAAAIDAYFAASLKEHAANAFSRPLADGARAQAKSFFEQRIADKRAEICAAHLKLVEDVKAAPGKFTTADCGSAAVVALLDQYLGKVAGTYDQNHQLMTALLNDHLNRVKLKLFDIARGSTASLDGTFQGQPLATASQEVKFEWIKQEASRLGAEAHLVWGFTNPNPNPLVQRNFEIAQEAARARQERDAAKARFHSDGKLAGSCKLK